MDIVDDIEGAIIRNVGPAERDIVLTTARCEILDLRKRVDELLEANSRLEQRAYDGERRLATALLGKAEKRQVLSEFRDFVLNAVHVWTDKHVDPSHNNPIWQRVAAAIEEG